MPVQVENLTDYPTREVAALVRYAHRELEVNNADVVVRVKYSRYGVRGRYYCNAALHSTTIRGGNGWGWEPDKRIEVRVPKGVRHLITIGIPRQNFPRSVHYYSRRETPPNDIWHSWQEALVWVAAHEANHHWQWLNRSTRKSGRRRWQFVESECDFAGYRVLKRWRAR